MKKDITNLIKVPHEISYHDAKKDSESKDTKLVIDSVSNKKG